MNRNLRTPKVIYIEFLSVRLFLLKIFYHVLLATITNKENTTHYYFETTKRGKIFANFIGIIFNYRFDELKFKLSNIKDNRGECIKLKIDRKELFEFQNNIITSDDFISISKDWFENKLTSEFIKKSLITGHFIDDNFSPSHSLYLIQVVSWHCQLSGFSKPKFFMSRRLWMRAYDLYAIELGVNLFFHSFYNPHKLGNSRHAKSKPVYRYTLMLNLFIILVKRFIKKLFYILHIIFKYIKSVSIKPTSVNHLKRLGLPKIIIKDFGQFNLENNGYNSDFFFLLNSYLPSKYVAFRFNSNEQKNALVKNGIYDISSDNISSSPIKLKRNRYPIIKHNLMPEFYRLNSENIRFHQIKAYWNYLSKNHNLKVYLTWYKYSNRHIATAAAFIDNGGISAVWERSFEGVPSPIYSCFVDISFRSSLWALDNQRINGSSVPYTIALGNLLNHIPHILIKKGETIKNRLSSHGAKHIISLFDGNSTHHTKWNYGHDICRETYTSFLNAVLDNPWLGVVFKPKKPLTLFSRLGDDVVSLLNDAQKTGRIHIYMETKENQSNVPAILAALSSDLCVHGHLCSGSAGIECASAGFPVLLMDMEGQPDSKLYQLEKDKVIFHNYSDMIEAIIENFQSSEGIPGFGDWSPIIDELDPFRDGKGAYRMGTYLHWLIQGFEQGLNREVVLANAAERYCKQWGYDKISVN